MLKTEIFRKYNNTEDIIKKEEDIRLALLSEPEDIDKLRELAALTYFRKNYQGSINVYEKLIKLEVDNGENFAFLGFLYYEIDELEKAIEYFLKAIEKIKNAPFVHFLLGNAYSRIGNIVEATKHFDLAIFSDIDIYNLHLEFAKKYEEMGRYKKALREYRAAYEIDPRDRSILDKIIFLKQKIK